MLLDNKPAMSHAFILLVMVVLFWQPIETVLLSVRKRAFQSSTGSPLGSADHAVDGSLKSNFSQGSCIQTWNESNPWWMVDLGSRCLVESVVVTNREDCCHEEINGGLILIGDSPFGGGISNLSCGTISSLGPGETKSFLCGMMKGQYVTIAIPGFNRVLNLCEVQVFGQRLKSSRVSNSPTEGISIVEVSKNKKTFQSSTSNKFGVSEEVYNKSLASDLKAKYCIETQKEKDPWWTVDLQSTFPIEFVSLTGRRDCCQYEMDGALILVGNSSGNGGKSNLRCAVISTLAPGKKQFFQCKGMNGQFVTLTVPGSKKILTVCEVQVFAKISDAELKNQSKMTENTTQHQHTGPGKKEKVQTSQSTVFIPSQFPDKPMDGSSRSGHCVQTLQENDPWWMADLYSTQIVDSVSITNLKNCCHEQRNGVIILVGDSPDQNGKLNARCTSVRSFGSGKTLVFKCGRMKGRYVTITNPGRKKMLSFCNVQIFGKPWNSNISSLATSSDDFYPLLPISGDVPEITRTGNSSTISSNFNLSENNFAPVLSNGKLTFQSSIFIPSKSPERVIDGPLGDFGKDTCIQTNREINPWWMVDLGSTQTVGSVAITTRKDCCSEELRGALILVGDSPDKGGMSNARCAIIGSLSHGKTEFFQCESMRGRYVSVVIPKKETFLSFCEVRVFGRASESISPDLPSPWSSSSNASNGTTGPELSKQRPTSQSSVFIPSQFPEKAMEVSVHSGHCVQTQLENDPWWMIDLGSIQTVGFVSITNRKDCCPEQIQGTLILVGDSPDQGGKWNARCAIIPSLGLGMKHVFNCEEMNGRYVSIIHPGREKVLSFCDVKVFGKTWNSGHNVFHDSPYFLPTSDGDQHITSHGSYGSYYYFDLTENTFAPVLSKGKRAFQSSISVPSGSPERAVDGSLLDDFEKGTCIQTYQEINPWWMVDLGWTETVKSVAITPRKDCCAEELHGAFILVGESSENGGTLNFKCAVIGSMDNGKTEFFRCGTMRGRYVSIINPKKATFLSFCEVRVFGKASDSISTGLPSPTLESWPHSPKANDDPPLTGPELSKQRPTSQSSVFIPSQFPEKPVEESIHSDHCVQTQQENDPWWMIDLGSTQTLGSVSITNRKDCCPEQIQGTLILVGDSPDQGGKWNARCAIIPSLGLGMKHVSSCEEMNGRYVSIIHPGREKVLSFCDVKVFGKTWNSAKNVVYDSSYSLSTSGDDQQITSHGSYYNFDLTENNFAPVLSEGKPAFQSSTCAPSGSPEKAVDGSLPGNFEKGTCIHTQQEANPWWMVDLGSTEIVKSVAITPRKDCCTEELHGALILVGDSPHNGGTFNTRCAVIGSLGRGKTEFFRCGTMKGRYVSVVSPKRATFLSFCEVRVFGKASDSVSPPSSRPESWPFSPKNSGDTALTGLLQSKRYQTSQSSIFIPPQFPDKPMDRSSQSEHCIQTLQENDPWWMADLGSTESIDFVSIINRKDCCKKQLNGALILVGDSPNQGGKFNARCAVILFLGLEENHVFSCRAMSGRYVTIIHPGKEKVLSFCDVKVFVKTWNSDNNTFIYTSYISLSTSFDDQEITRQLGSPERSYAYDGKENSFAPVLSRGKPAFQSSIASPYGSPERAVDGSLFSEFEKSSCIQTHRENNPWWIVDLGSTQTVESVAITTQKSCCTEELNGALILVGDSFDNGGSMNSRCAIIGFLSHSKTEFFKCGTLKGRYVSIFNPGRKKMLSLCEVQVLGKASDSVPTGFFPASLESSFLSSKASNDTDLTGLKHPKGAQTSQSSIFIPSQFPNKPMDGSSGSGHCVQTLQENDPWWMVDLGSTQTIDYVSVTNQKDCCKEQLHGALILVGDSPDQGGKFNARCAVVPSRGQRMTHIFSCGKMKGRYVTIIHLGKQKILSFCDIKIFGKTWGLFSFANENQQKTRSAATSVTTYTENNFDPVLSRGKPAFQSSIASPSGSPERAVDGSLLGDFEKGTCIQTNQENDPWWIVDLGSTHIVKSVAITPRKDCCTEELRGAQILVGDLPINGGTLNARCAVIYSLSQEKAETFRCGMIPGRYVSIFNPGKERMISLCEVQVFGKASSSLAPGRRPSLKSHIPLFQDGNAMDSTVPLVSKGKPAFQSSTFSPLGSPENAVDGFLFSEFYEGSCMQTYPENEPWWMVDLGSLYSVETVSITSRRDCCSELMNGAMILVGDSKYLNGRLNPRCAIIPAIRPGKTQAFSCGSMKGRYVTITILGKGKFLTMCEVQVFGKPFKGHDHTLQGSWKQIFDSVKLLSRGKSASQSSVSCFSASPERALDMSFQSDFGKSSCIRTLQETGPWWMADLGSSYSVIFVSLTNQDNCCQEQVNEAMILVGDSSYKGGSFNTKCVTISSVPPRKTILFSCGAMLGRYVTIVVPGRGKVLTLCKVEIFGTYDNQQFIPSQMDWFSTNSNFPEILFASNPRQNYLAQISLKQKAVSQSTILNHSGTPERAVDDSLESDFDTGSCIQTQQQTDPWWMIDLESTHFVESVTITNRRDCCHEQIYGAAILIGDSSEHGGKSNPRCATIFSLGPGKSESFNCGSLSGRYVTITIPGRRKILTFCEVQVYGKMIQSEIRPSYPNILHKLSPISNKDTLIPSGRDTTSFDPKKYISPYASLISQGMNVFQSSISSHLGSPEKAIDGSLTGDFRKGSCIQTIYEYEPWWMIDLGSSYAVDYVAITNRKDCCHDQLNGAMILVGDSSANGGKFNSRCATISSLDPGRTESFFCESVIGRYVTVTIPGRKAFLTFCEVQAFSKLAPSLPPVLPKSTNDFYRPMGVNIALGKTSYQSSTFHPLGSSDKATDGNGASDFYKNSCTHTNDDFEPWWMVDLTSKFNVDNIIIIPRGDRCTEIAAKYEIRIGNSKENGGKGNPRCGDKARISPGQRQVFKCDGMQGRFITIFMPEIKEFLSLCEVEVFGMQVINSG